MLMCCLSGKKKIICVWTCRHVVSHLVCSHYPKYSDVFTMQIDACALDVIFAARVVALNVSLGFKLTGEVYNSDWSSIKLILTGWRISCGCQWGLKSGNVASWDFMICTADVLTCTPSAQSFTLVRATRIWATHQSKKNNASWQQSIQICFDVNAGHVLAFHVWYRKWLWVCWPGEYNIYFFLLAN